MCASTSYPSDCCSLATSVHSQHSFPHDFRSGPSPLDWDPSKWAIMLLHSLGLASGLRRARVEEISAAREHMLQKEFAMVYSTDSAEESEREHGRKNKLGRLAKRRFEAMLRALSGRRGELARCMAFSLEHAEAASEV